MPVNLDSFMQMKSLLDSNVNNILAQEVALYSDKLQIAGRVDCIAEWCGKLSIIDFKTSRKPKKKEWIENYFIQTAFYAAALFERVGIPIKNSVILVVPDEACPQVFCNSENHNYIAKLFEIRNEYRKKFNF